MAGILEKGGFLTANPFKTEFGVCSHPNASQERGGHPPDRGTFFFAIQNIPFASLGANAHSFHIFPNLFAIETQSGIYII
jgi:hypothetical protein